MAHEPIRVLIVDDSRIFRGFLESALAECSDAVVVGSVFSGEKAIEFLKQNPVDLVTLDIEMPGLDGLATLQAIRDLNRARVHQPPVETLLVSSLTRQGASYTVEGLQLGAIDFILKPSAGTEAENRRDLKRALTDKLKLFEQKRWKSSESPTFMAKSDSRSQFEGLRLAKPGTYRAIAIGISTGGPETLVQLLPDIAGKTQVPIFIVQHNLDGLSSYMAESLTRRIGFPVVEAQQDMRIEPGGIYLAQSGKHMVVRVEDNHVVLGISDAPPENHCRPAVDVFLRSASALYGSSLIAVIMTGMLNDGASGVRVVKRAGGYVIAQDQTTSVIWGMPKAAIETGAVDAVLPLQQIAPTLLKLVESQHTS